MRFESHRITGADVDVAVSIIAKEADLHPDELLQRVALKGKWKIESSDHYYHKERLRRELLKLNWRREYVGYGESGVQYAWKQFEITPIDYEAELARLTWGKRQIREHPDSIEDWCLSVRIFNCLRNAGLETLSQVERTPDSQLLKTRNFGKKSLRELRELIPFRDAAGHSSTLASLDPRQVNDLRMAYRGAVMARSVATLAMHAFIEAWDRVTGTGEGQISGRIVELSRFFDMALMDNLHGQFDSWGELSNAGLDDLFMELLALGEEKKCNEFNEIREAS